MRKHYIISSIFVLILAISAVFWTLNVQAHEEDGVSGEATEVIEPVTSADLGVSDPGTLPTSRWYFFKEWGRGIQRVFTFNSVAKAELELKIANEKAAEVAKVKELNPNDETAIAKALENYKQNQERLKTRLESLKETSQNPNVDRLLEKLAERTVQHEKLFTEIGKKFEDKREITDKIDFVRAGLVDRVSEAAKKDDPEKFAKRFEKKFDENKGLRHLGTIEFVDRMQGRLPEDPEEHFMKLRDEFSEKLDGELKNTLEKHDAEEVKEMIKQIPGDFDRHLLILDEIRAKDGNQLPETFGKVADELNNEAVKEGDIKERAEKQIKRAEELIKLFEEKLAHLVVGLPQEKRETQANTSDFAINEPGVGVERTACDDKQAPACSPPQISECHNGKWVCIGPATPQGRFAINEPGVPNDKKKQVERILDEAKFHLNKAREDFARGEFGSAFGHGRSAEVIARNGLRMLESGLLKPGGPDFPRPGEAMPPRPGEFSPRPSETILPRPEETRMQRSPFESRCEILKRNLYELELMFKNHQISENDFKIKSEALRKEFASCAAQTAPAPRSLEIKPLPLPPVYPGSSICEQIKKYLAELAEMFRAGRISEADYKLKYENLQKNFVNCVSQSEPAPTVTEPKPTIIKPLPVKTEPIPIATEPLPVKTEPASTMLEPTTISPQTSTGGIVCTQDYNPVCGANGKTYSNACFAKVAGVGVAYQGECRVTAVCSDAYKPVCGENGKTYSNECLAKVAGVAIKYAGVCQTETISSTPGTGTVEPAPSVIQPETSEFKMEADDYGFYPAYISVTKGSKVKLTLIVRTAGVYYGGLQFASPKFKTDAVKPGNSTIVEFYADESFSIQSYWPLTSVLKSSAKVIVK